MSLAKNFSESNGEIQYFMEHIRRVYIPSCTQRSNIYNICDMTVMSKWKTEKNLTIFIS